MKMKTTLTLLLIMEVYRLSSGLKQHFFVDMQKRWCIAQKHCKTYFHALSTFINENEEQRFLANAPSRTSDAWIGVRKNPKTNVWKWEQSKDTDAEHLKILDLPTNIDNKNCGFLLRSNNQLQHDQCNISKPFFCMTNFTLVSQKETWEGALEYCKTHYNDLAILSTRNRINSALIEISQVETEYVWTGLHFLTGDWFWLSGEDLDYTAWFQARQSQCPAGNLRCGALDKQTKLLTHRNCEEKLSFFCQ